MEQKRKAAASVFREQNIVEQQQFDELSQSSFQVSSAPGAPMQLEDRLERQKKPLLEHGLKTSEELQLEKEPLRVRETGFWLWRRIIIPPNAYVVHTRMGKKEPITLGLGISFGYNPYTDAYLVVPAAMQTIGIVANCISKEKQGINILAYVQWQINDFSVAYRKLDFSDSRDPLGIVNAQLREQAEAAIKDKIATMSVEEVLTDKEPIIEELTARLKAVSEGRNLSDQAIGEGLGIKIVTVQIKEALVSSQRLWEHLQAPFRYEQEKTAKISYLLTQSEIRQKELENRQLAETGEVETMVAIERIKQSKQTEALEIKLVQEATRFTREQESIRQKVQLTEQTTLAQRKSEQRLQTQSAIAEQEMKLASLGREQEEAIEKVRLDSEAGARQKTLYTEQALHTLTEETRLAKIKLQADQERLDRETTLKKLEAAFKQLAQERDDLLQSQILTARLTRQREETKTRLELEEAANQVKIALLEKEVELSRLQQEVRNLMNERDISARLIDKLPELAAQMPEIHELKVLQMNDANGSFESLTPFLAKILALAESLGISLTKDKKSQSVKTQ